MSDMKIDINQFRVREGDRVRLNEWPGRVKPLYRSKKHYEKLLAEHREKVSALQSLPYAHSRYALHQTRTRGENCSPSAGFWTNDLRPRLP